METDDSIKFQIMNDPTLGLREEAFNRTLAVASWRAALRPCRQEGQALELMLLAMCLSLTVCQAHFFHGHARRLLNSMSRRPWHSDIVRIKHF